ncbi:MAG TPA: C40 family peptidase [Gemmatimonadaceae bacterium]|jgi:cell wall-associated NlpC family hydrolase|nr:C40 family peptidase [Gemmatimonadaceae bacterium]
MQSQSLRNAITSRTGPVAAAALCAATLCAPQARAQLSVGPVKIDVAGTARSSAAARTVLAAIGATRTTSASRVLPTAERYLGVPYRWGGTSPRTGFDCSGFVQYVFAKHGTRLPRTSREMASSGQRLRPQWSALKPGDLVLFAEPGERISHVAIYAGSRRIIHASSSGRHVRYDVLDTKRGRWFTRRIVAARRVSPRGAALVSDLLAQHTIDAVVPHFPLDPPDQAPLPRD